jgi:hypothetical protein
MAPMLAPTLRHMGRAGAERFVQAAAGSVFRRALRVAGRIGISASARCFEQAYLALLGLEQLDRLLVE